MHIETNATALHRIWIWDGGGLGAAAGFPNLTAAQGAPPAPKRYDREPSYYAGCRHGGPMSRQTRFPYLYGTVIRGAHP
jgi:hypothetical protein